MRFIAGQYPKRGSPGSDLLKNKYSADYNRAKTHAVPASRQKRDTKSQEKFSRFLLLCVVLV